MTTSSLSATTGVYALLQSLLQGVSTDLSTGNNLPSSQSSSAESSTPPPLPPPPLSDSSASSQFSGDTLSSLVSTQDTSATAEADQIVDAFDTNGDGSLSLSDIENALSGSSSTSSVSTASTTTSSSSLSSSSLSSSSVQTAFSAIDTNGDGELSTSEIANAIENLDSSQFTEGPPMGPPPPPSGSDANGASTSTPTTASSTDASSASASSTTTSTTSPSALSETQIAHLLQSLVAQLASLQYDAASGLQNAAAAGTITTTTA